MAYTKAKAKQVTYKNDGAGSVVRDLHDKLGEFVSVKDFGAVGDGVTDDTAAIQSAVNFATVGKKILFAPSGNYLITGSGISFHAQFPGLIGEGTFRTVFYYTGTGTAITLGGSGSLGVYRDWQVVAGVFGANESTARSVARNGIYWNCYGGQGEIRNVKALYFNGFGMKFEAIWDSVVNNVVVESCGNASEYAFSVVNGTDTANHTNFSRVQVELAYTKAFLFEGLNNVMVGLHTERTTGNGTDYTHVIRGDVCVIDGRIEDTANVYSQVGIANGFLKNVKFASGFVDFSWAARLDSPAPIENCVFGSKTYILAGNLRHYHFKDCTFVDDFISRYAEKYTKLVNCTVKAGVGCDGSNVKIRMEDCRIENIIAPVGGVNTIEIDGGEYAYFPTNEYVIARNALFTNEHTTPFTQQATAIGCTFAGALTVQNNNAKWVSENCDFNGGIVLGTGNPSWAFGLNDTFAGVTGAFGAAPTTGTWASGHRAFNPAPTIGQPKSWVCTVSGTPGTWVSEGNL